MKKKVGVVFGVFILLLNNSLWLLRHPNYILNSATALGSDDSSVPNKEWDH